MHHIINRCEGVQEFYNTRCSKNIMLDKIRVKFKITRKKYATNNGHITSPVVLLKQKILLETSTT